MDKETAIAKAKALADYGRVMVVWYNKLTNLYHVLPQDVYGKIDKQVVYII